MKHLILSLLLLLLPFAAYPASGVGSKAATDTMAYRNSLQLGAEPTKQMLGFAVAADAIVGWQNLVYWTFRPTQTVAEGTTVQSIGGFGSYPGTLTNGPTWGANGLETNNTGSQHVVTTLEFSYNADSTLLFAGILSPSASTGRRIFGAPGGSSGAMLYVLTVSNTTESFRNAIFISPTGLNVNLGATEDLSLTHNFFGSSINSSTTTANWTTIRNERTGVGNWSNPANTQALYILKGQTAPDYWSGSAAFAAYANVTTTAAQLQAMRAAYKRTLGVGLSLP